MQKPIIYLYCQRAPEWAGGRIVGYALAEDGTQLVTCVSSTREWAKFDLGYSSDTMRERYKEHYPGGYRLEWIEEHALAQHAGFMAAYNLNCERSRR